jgi:hypothetical protein
MRKHHDCTIIPGLRDCGRCKIKYCRTLGKGVSGIIAEEFEKALLYKRPVDMAGLSARVNLEFPGVEG